MAWPALARLTMEQHKSGRDAPIDIGRFIAICAVAALHSVDRTHYASSLPATGSTIGPGEIIDQLARFAVPYFFLASGYFLSPKPSSSVLRSIWEIIKRIGPPYLAWTLAFNLPYPGALSFAAHNPGGFFLRIVLQGGAAPHLWFLPSLVICLALALVSIRFLPLPTVLFGGFLLYAIGLLIGSYAFLIFGKPATPLQLHLARDAPSFGFVFVVVGFWLRRTSWRPTLTFAACLFAVGAATQLFESMALARFGAHAIPDSDYVIGTLPFGLGAFLLARTWPRIPLTPSVWAALGTCSLGLYAIHPAFVLIFGPLLNPHSFVARLGIWALSVIGSIVIVVEMVRLRQLRWLVK
jgi:surface polysaccharide O-acyltransferase-like enzyme